MKIGVCAGYDQAAAAKAAGFAYLEPQVAATAAMTDEDFAEAKAAMAALGMETPVFNVLFPGSMLLLSDKLSMDELQAYLHRALSRVQQMGGTRVVFGSGRSRRRPDAMPYDAAFRRLVQVTRVIGDVAAEYGVTIVIEPLNRDECNMINTVGEGACLAAAADHPNVKLLADHYHMALDQDPAGDILRVGGVLHAHIAEKVDRQYPLQANDEIVGFIRALKASGYDELLSVEGRTKDMAADGPVSVQVLRSCWENA